MKKTLTPFVALSVAAPAALLLVYPIYSWSESLAMASLSAGVLLMIALLVLSCASLYRRQSRGFVGLLACLICFWQVLVIPGYIMVVKQQREQQRSNHPAGRRQARASLQSGVLCPAHTIRNDMSDQSNNMIPRSLKIVSVSP